VTEPRFDKGYGVSAVNLRESLKRVRGALQDSRLHNYSPKCNLLLLKLVLVCILVILKTGFYRSQIRKDIVRGVKVIRWGVLLICGIRNDISKITVT
jgi:hypothetical protein